MHIKALKDALMLCRQARLTPFIWGHKGMGKSSTVKQLAEYITGRKDDGIEQSPCIDLRCAQMEASDIRGIPAPTDDGRTRYFVPSQFPMEDDGIFFLDEINRAEDDVLHATFELVLDRRVGEYRVPDGWSIVCAGNYSEGEYTVNAFNDAAFLDRFVHLELTKSKEYDQQWTEYISELYPELADKVIQFTSFEDTHLTGKSTGELGFTRGPSPRSWEAVLKVEKAYREGFPLYENGKPVMDGDVHVTRPYDEEAYKEVVKGLVGLELAMQYFRFKIDVTPDDIIGKGVESLRKKLDTLERGHMVGLIWGVVSRARNHIKPDDKNDEKRVTHVLDFLEYTANHKERDLAVMAAKGIVHDEVGQVSSGAALVNTQLANMIAQFQKKPTWLNAIIKRKTLQELLAKVGLGK